MSDISGSDKLVTSFRKYHGKIMEIGSKRAERHFEGKHGIASCDKVSFSSTESYQNFLHNISLGSDDINEILKSLAIKEQSHWSEISFLFTESNTQNHLPQTSNQDRTVGENFVEKFSDAQPSRFVPVRPGSNPEQIASSFINNDTNIENSRSGVQLCVEGCEDYQKSLQYKHSEEYKNYMKLRKRRDINCIRMVEVSKALNALKSNPRRDWYDVLLAEQILLGSAESEKLLIHAIRENTYISQVMSDSHSASLELSNFEFKLTTEKKNKKKKTFFILAVSHETQLFVSETRQPDEANLLRFSKEFVFDDVRESFQIQLKLFSITKSKERFRRQCGSTTKMLFANLNTADYEEKEVFKPCFKFLAGLTLTRSDLDKTTFTLISVNLTDTKINSPKLKKSNNANFNFKAQSVFIHSNLSGFLTLGQKKEGAIFWDRKWCVLNKTELAIYNYPSEQDLGVQPQIHINLNYCFELMLNRLSNSLKKQIFVLKTGRSVLPSTQQSPTLDPKPIFFFEKFYFSADSQKDLENWTNEIKSVLDSLRNWNKLFLDPEN